MPLEQLLDALRSEADEEIVRLRADSEAEAARIRDEARDRVGELEAEPVRRAEEEAGAQARRRLAVARLEAARRLRRARADGFEEVMDALAARLAALREDDGYRRLLDALIRESREALPEGRRLLVDARDAATAEDVAGDGLELDPCLDGWGGVALDAGDGRVLRNTLEERLANAEPLLRRRFAALLDDRGGAP